MATALTEHHLPNDRELALALALDIAQRLTTAVAERGSAMLAVSGGKSPVALFQALAAQPLLASLWPHITVLLVDERCVPSTHPDSNARLVHQHLLQGAAAAAHWVPLVELAQGQQTTEQASMDVQELCLATERRLSPLPWPLDVAVLGMGLDAHTASFFPGAPGLTEALTTPARCAWVLPDPVLNNAHHARLTLSLCTLLAARHLCLPLSGAAKQAVYTQARQAATAKLPVSLLLCQTQTPVAVWLSP